MAFSAELQRDSIMETMEEIDNQLTEQGAPDEIKARCDLMMDNALALSTMMVNNNSVDREAAVTDIAYSLVYAFGKGVGFNVAVGLRGLTGSYIRNSLRLNPCLTEIDFQQETQFLSQQIASHENDDDDWDFDLSKPPTIH